MFWIFIVDKGLLRHGFSTITLSFDMNDFVKPNVLTKDLALRRPEDAVIRVPSTKGSSPSQPSLHSPPRSRVAGASESHTVIEQFDVQDATPLPSPMSKAMVNKERLYFIAMCMTMFLAGWNE